MLKSTILVVPNWGGRDDGKTFLLTEKPASVAEKWAYRLFLAIKGTTAQVPDDVARLGMVGVAIRGINSFLAADIRWSDIDPLLDEMFTCVQIIRDPKHPSVSSAPAESDIEEVQTRGWLRSEVLRLHTNFSFIDAVSTLLSMSKAASPTT
jgi:hypothetical protein